jgi:hypothetical protein
MGCFCVVFVLSQCEAELDLRVELELGVCLNSVSRFSVEFELGVCLNSVSRFSVEFELGVLFTWA